MKKVLEGTKRVLAMLMVVLMVFGLVPSGTVEVLAEDGANTLTINMDATKGEVVVVDTADENTPLDDEETEDANKFVYTVADGQTYKITFNAITEDEIYGVYNGTEQVALENGAITVEVTAENNAFSYDVRFVSDATREVTASYKMSEITSVAFTSGVETETLTTDGVTTMKYSVLPTEEVMLHVVPVIADAVVKTNVGTSEWNEQEAVYVVTLDASEEATTVTLSDDYYDVTVDAQAAVDNVLVYADDTEVIETNGVYSIKENANCYVTFESELPLKKLIATNETITETQDGYKVELGVITEDTTLEIVEKEFPKVTITYDEDKVTEIKVTVDGNEVFGTSGTLEFEAEENVDYVVTVTPADDDAAVTVDDYTVNGTTGDRTFTISGVETATNLEVEVVDVYTVDFIGNFAEINRLDAEGNVIDTVENGKLNVREDEATIKLQIVPGTDKYIKEFKYNGTDVAFDEAKLDTTDFSYTYEVTVVDGDVVAVDVADVKVANPVAMNTVITSTHTGEATEVSGVDVYYIRENITLTPVTSGAKLLFDNTGFVASKELTETTTLTGITVLVHNATFEEGMLQTYEFETEVSYVVDKVAPTVDASLSTEYFGPNSLTIKLSGAVTDDVEVDHVVYFAENKDVAADRDEILAGTNVVDATNGQYEFTITLDETIVSDVSYYVYAIDLAGNITKVGPITVTYDGTAPVDGSVVINNIAAFFGEIFVATPILVVDVINVADGAAGVADIKVSVYDENDTLVDEGFVDEDNRIIFDAGIVNGKAYKFKVVATDKVGNQGLMYQAEIVVDGNRYPQVSYDGTAPLVTVKPATGAVTEGVFKENANTYYINQTVANDGYELEIDVNDYLEGNTNNLFVSGLAEVTVKINGTEILVDAEGNALADYSVEKKYIDSFNINILQGTLIDGAYKITVDAKDNAGNAYDTYTVTVYVDTTDPSVQSVTVNNQNATLGDAFQSYGFFANNVFNIQINTIDGANNASDSKISHYVVEYLQGTTVVKTETITGNQLSYTKQITDNFKGTIRVTVYDNVGNSSTKTLVNGLIFENANTHATNAGATLTTLDTTMKDVNGVKLYSDNTSVGVVVTDNYAGIEKIEWSVVAPFDKGNDILDGFEISKISQRTDWKAETTDNGIVTKVSGTIPVSNNSNNITVEVTITDNAGNTSTSSVVVSIDKTVPTINVSVAGDDADSQYTSTFNGDRVATITIRERNFKSSDVKVTITNTDGVIPSVTTWTKKEDASNPDNNTYTATVTFAADGDYTLDVAYTDLAKRAATAPAQQKLTIDKTAPAASVSIDGNASNGYYFASGRTATIVINEHNFDSNRVQLTGTATNNGASVSIPSISSWSTSGDTHTATIRFTEDADYQLVLSGIDQAGNTFTYEVPNFVIDQVVPTITISGVENQSANAGDVVPVITLGDVNYDANGVNITLVGANNGSMELNGSFSDSADGQVFTFSNFPNEKEYDDIYTLTATKTDMAGNETVETITFSVNRFGSVYTFSDELKEVVGKYVKQPFEIVLTETNIDRLDPASIKVVLTVNGTPKTLVLDVDYTISQSGSDASWKQYVYTINPSVFEGDGSYSLALYSVDSAGNVNENINEVKEAEVIFGIDSTAPVVEAFDLNNGDVFNTAPEVTLSAIDNILLNTVKVLLNGKEVEVIPNPDNEEMFTFTIPESSSAYTIVITAIDEAGNETSMEYTDVWVTSNPFISFIRNTPLLIGSIAGVAAVGGGAGAFVFFRRRNVIKVKK